MATSKKTVAKASKKTATAKKPTAKKAAAPKKAAKAPAKKPVKPVAKKAAAPKKAVKKVTAKKAAPAKKTVKKVEVVKKNISTKKIVTKKTTSKTVTKKTTSPTKKATAPTKKTTTPTKKATVAAKKTTTAKKVVAPKKAVVTKPAPKKATVVVAAPKKAADKKVVATKPAVATATKAKKTAKTPVRKIIKAPITSAVASTPSRPSLSGISRAAREEKKSNVIVAHRKLETKSKKEEPIESVEKFKPQTHSILNIRQEEEPATGPVYRYNDEDLAEFKELILNRMEAARKELAYLQGLITRKDEAGTEDTENRYMNMEDGSGAMEREQLAQLASRQIQFIGHLEKALLRIENKTYGVCRVTGKLIDKARLRAVPHATLSIEAKMTMSK